ncbi:MAG: bifunctional hydroxymethylpyrimidine kinase/phosphomethylpyrimidine kinase [Rhodospirillaceae bacterium]|nr:bifunctional hydroxymethylpyrimidine kinase/phosphomethylpyrimidine kinase [Rhodospirillaceae bacterium]
MAEKQGRVLIVAGSDSGGGAGIQADIKTVTALGGYAATAVTALTVQNTNGVFGVEPVEPAFIAHQMKVVLEDIGADVLKTGMLHSVPVIEAVAGVYRMISADLTYVLDPVMFAKGGHPLLDPSATDALKRRLLPLADVVTPNIPEAEALSGMKIDGPDDMEAAANAILAMGPGAVLLKGGHLEGDQLVDLLVTSLGAERYRSERIDTRHTHGTGCTLASAIATGLSQGMVLDDAVARGRDYVFEAIRLAPGLGTGHGPLQHGHTVAPFPKKS